MLNVKRGDRLGEEQIIAPADFLNQTDDLRVCFKPVVIKSLKLPIPVGSLKSGSQPARPIAGFKDGDGVAVFLQIKGGA